MADEPKPPYVRFETRPIEDREATLEAGHYVGRDVVFALVTPAGSKDMIEKEAEDWLKNIEEGVKQERIPQMWLEHYRRAYENYKEQRQQPETGTPLRDWPAISPSLLNTLLDINIRTIEDLAEANEEAMHRMGMGGRALKQKAIIWLQQSQDSGKVTEELAALKVRNQELEARDKEREEQFKKLQAQVDALTEKEKA